MGKYEQGILGGFSGKVGAVTGYSGVSGVVIRGSSNAKKHNPFSNQLSVKGWVNNIDSSFDLILQQFIDNIFVFVVDYQNAYKKSLLNVVNKIRHKDVGVYDCDPLFASNLPFLSSYSVSYNAGSGNFQQIITNMGVTLPGVSTFGILDFQLGISGISIINQGFQQAPQNRTLTRNLLSAGMSQYVYCQSLITDYGTSKISFCPAKVLRLW